MSTQTGKVPNILYSHHLKIIASLLGVIQEEHWRVSLKKSNTLFHKCHGSYKNWTVGSQQVCKNEYGKNVWLPAIANKNTWGIPTQKVVCVFSKIQI